MSLPHKQNPDEDERPVLHVPTRKSVGSERAALRNRGTSEVPKVSRLSAQMVELSLQQAQREPTLHDTLPATVNIALPTLHEALPAKVNVVSPPLHDTLSAKPKAVSLPLPWPSTVAAPPHPPQPQATPRESKIPNYWHNHWPNFKNEVRRNLDNWLAAARVIGSAAVQHLSEHAKSAQKKFALSNFRTKSRFGTASRLWTSTGMAAVAAVLVVGAISGVRHYAHTPDTPQHSGQNASPVTPAMQDLSQPPRTSTVNTNGAAMQHPATSSPAVKHSPAEPGTRKVRRKDKDDDYVAKDTFVSYDKKGKPTR
jgi:hypothetical protein